MLDRSIRTGTFLVALAALLACSSGGGSPSSGGDPGGGPPGGGGGGGCTPLATCETLWCGPHPDGCGGTIECGATCSGGDTCGGVTPGTCSSCSADGVCVETPDIWKGGYSSIFGTSATDVWAVELDDAIFEWDGTGWNDRTSTAIVTTYSTVPNGPGRVWGTSPTKLWGVSSWGVFRWNGTAWSFVEGRFLNLESIWGTSDTDVWAVGGSGTIIHWDGTAWSRKASGTTEYLLDVWATAPDDAWAVGLNGVLLRWDGTSWTRPNPVSTTVAYRRVQAIGPGEALVLTDKGEIARWDGTGLVSWAPGQVGTALDLWAFGPSDVWRVGDYGTIQHWDGTGWKTYANANDSTALLNAVWGAPNGDVWIASNGNKVLRLKAAAP